MSQEVANMLGRLQSEHGISQVELAVAFGASPASIRRWISGTADPSPTTADMIRSAIATGQRPAPGMFASHGARRGKTKPPSAVNEIELSFADPPLPPVIDRLYEARAILTPDQAEGITKELQSTDGAPTVSAPPEGGISAGKNTYTYDAHTYHTKVPPQGIAELIRHYLPEGGIVLDPFAGSGMTAVAARTLGVRAILNELSPAACFIADRFVADPDADRYVAAIDAIVDRLDRLRKELYTTECRECGLDTEILYTVWSYRVNCTECEHNFNLWDVVRSYGRTVREHKILKEFPCPECNAHLKKRSLARTIAEPVQVGYICCGHKRTEVTHPLNDRDLDRIAAIEAAPALAEGFYPSVPLPEGVNLNQPARHGLTSVDKFYTARNLVALSHIWKEIARIEDLGIAAQAAFTFTSLYRRVSRLSEFRFWGGSGNTARLNVPTIFEEQNVFVSFLRKAKTIRDHLVTTASHFHGEATVVQGTATNMSWLPDDSIDFIFTDPPFGAYINYSEMNLLWESWLGRFTDNSDEAIVNKVHGKTLDDYRRLMTESMQECYRVLRPGHWMDVVFMNSSATVWEALDEAIRSAGFVIVEADVFDKQHGTFKHFVSPNTAGADLVLHCLKPAVAQEEMETDRAVRNLSEFLASVDLRAYRLEYLHVNREDEPDLRRLYSEWVAESLLASQPLMDFADFRNQILVEAPED